MTHEWERSEFLRAAVAGYAEAARRVGKDNRKRLSWLLEFIYLSPETLAKLPERERTQWRYDLAHFAAVLTPMKLPQLDVVATAAAEIRKGIEQLKPFSHWTFELTKDCTIERTIEPRLVKRAGRSVLDGYQSYYTSDDIRAAFLLCAADVIEAEGTRIRVCAQKECGRRFARHRRARYCSARCSQRERDLRFRRRLTETERSERRHGYYMKKMRKKFGEAVVVKPRRTV